MIQSHIYCIGSFLSHFHLKRHLIVLFYLIYQAIQMHENAFLVIGVFDKTVSF
jgi:hypothetical protein